MSFGKTAYSVSSKPTKRDEFFSTMEEIIPWKEWVEYIRSYYPGSQSACSPEEIERMLRMYLLQVWFSLSDENVEDAVLDSLAFRRFIGLKRPEEQLPDSGALMKFRHLLRKNKIGEQLFRTINYVLEQEGAVIKGGMIVDAAIIHVSESAS